MKSENLAGDGIVRRKRVSIRAGYGDGQTPSVPVHPLLARTAADLGEHLFHFARVFQTLAVLIRVVREAVAGEVPLSVLMRIVARGVKNAVGGDIRPGDPFVGGLAVDGRIVAAGAVIHDAVLVRISPVMSDAREGEQKGVGQVAFRKTTPRRASRSRLGVLTGPP